MKRVQIFLLLLFCTGYLATEIEEINTEVNTKSKSIENEVRELNKKRIEINRNYIKNRREDLFIKQELIDETKELMNRIIKLDQSNIKGDSEFTSKVLALEASIAALDEYSTKKSVYENFIESSCEGLLKLKDLQIIYWNKLKYDVENYNANPPEIDRIIYRQTKQKKIYDPYNEFITDLKSFNNITSEFSLETAEMLKFIEKFTDHLLNSQLTPAEKERKYIDFARVYCLKKNISEILGKIDPKNNDIFITKKPFYNNSFDLYYFGLPNKAIDLEKEEYKKIKQPEIAKLLSGLRSYIDTELSVTKIENMLDEKTDNTIMIEKEIAHEYEEHLRRILRIFYKEEQPSNLEDFSDDFRTQFDIVLKMNRLMINEGLDTIRSTKNYSETANSKLNLKVHDTIDLANENLKSTDILMWIESFYRNNLTDKKLFIDLAANLPDDNSNEDPKWKKKIQIGLDETPADKKKKTTLLTLGIVLRNVSKIFEGLTKVLYELKKVKVSSQHLIGKTKYIEAKTKAFFYAQKIKALKSAANCTTPLYTFCMYKFLNEINKNSNSIYSGLSLKGLSAVDNLAKIFFLHESKAHKVLHFLQELIKEFSIAVKELDFLLDENKLNNLNNLTDKLCNVDVKTLQPSKSLPITTKTSVNIMDAISIEVDRMSNIQKINSRPLFYNIQDIIIIFDTAIKVLERYMLTIGHRIQFVTELYKEANILHRLKELREKEKEKSIKESKTAFIECEKIILDTKDEIRFLLSKIGNINIYSPFPNSEPETFDSDYIFELPPLRKVQKEDSKDPFLTMTNFLMLFGALCLVLCTFYLVFINIRNAWRQV